MTQDKSTYPWDRKPWRALDVSAHADKTPVVLAVRPDGVVVALSPADAHDLFHDDLLVGWRPA